MYCIFIALSSVDGRDELKKFVTRFGYCGISYICWFNCLTEHFNLDNQKWIFCTYYKRWSRSRWPSISCFSCIHTAHCVCAAFTAYIHIFKTLSLSLVFGLSCSIFFPLVYMLEILLSSQLNRCGDDLMHWNRWYEIRNYRELEN